MLDLRETFPTSELGKAFVGELATLRNKLKLLLGEMKEVFDTAQEATDRLNEVVGDLQRAVDVYSP